jgi:hypothetical protein
MAWTDRAVRQNRWPPAWSSTSDRRRTYEELRARGAEFTEEPVERLYGTDCALRAPVGNHIRLTQAAPGPVAVPEGTAAG